MKKRIIITEDDPCLQDIYKIILEEAGYEVTVLATAAAIMNNDCPLPDIYILDKQMAGKNGIEVCQYLKSQVSTRNIPVIIISAAVGIKTMAKEAGADASIEKPFEKKLLLQTIEDYISG